MNYSQDNGIKINGWERNDKALPAASGLRDCFSTLLPRSTYNRQPPKGFHFLFTQFDDADAISALLV
jgi:hypothetical protein